MIKAQGELVKLHEGLQLGSLLKIDATASKTARATGYRQCCYCPVDIQTHVTDTCCLKCVNPTNVIDSRGPF